MRAYSPDLRERVLADCGAGMSTDQVAAKYRVSASWVRRPKQRLRETGSAAPIPQRHGPQPSWVAHADRIAEAVRERPKVVAFPNLRKRKPRADPGTFCRGRPTRR